MDAAALAAHVATPLAAATADPTALAPASYGEAGARAEEGAELAILTTEDAGGDDTAGNDAHGEQPSMAHPALAHPFSDYAANNSFPPHASTAPSRLANMPSYVNFIRSDLAPRPDTQRAPVIRVHPTVFEALHALREGLQLCRPANRVSISDVIDHFLCCSAEEVDRLLERRVKHRRQMLALVQQQQGQQGQAQGPEGQGQGQEGQEGQEGQLAVAQQMNGGHVAMQQEQAGQGGEGQAFPPGSVAAGYPYSYSALIPPMAQPEQQRKKRRRRHVQPPATQRKLLQLLQQQEQFHPGGGALQQQPLAFPQPEQQQLQQQQGGQQGEQQGMGHRALQWGSGPVPNYASQ
ncbi:hypothetical protein CLOM_g22425 [Closterium sp. NIES-68]|nr:hypothetical protein CLOM_g22425 [Closterium sp. NIES-68]GJP70231.1 hypothetical protein CLOP_g1196 [Closterium sp. NIES-67]